MQMEPRVLHQFVRGIDLALHEWPGEGPTILLCHATGFHARCWDRVVARLPERHVIAVDFRGHGLSEKIPPPCAWRTFGEDLALLTKQLELKQTKAVGHSMGGHSLVLAAALNPGAFSALLLLDPVILPPGHYVGPEPPLEFVLHRRNEWPSADAMFERFKSRAPFQSWDPAVLRDYCDHALDGTKLACPPDVEASIYANCNAPESDISAELARVATPARVVRSGTPYTYGAFAGSPTDPALATRLARGTDEWRRELSHFIPMEGPSLTAQLILSL